MLIKHPLDLNFKTLHGWIAKNNYVFSLYFLTLYNIKKNRSKTIEFKHRLADRVDTTVLKIYSRGKQTCRNA